jgi:SAM-dependent methyltransferase
MLKTEAEGFLVKTLVHHLRGFRGGMPRLLNVGAADSLSIETQLLEADAHFVVDRVDIDAYQVQAPYIGTSWTASAECMPEVPSDTYDAAFANFVLEHVSDLDRAATEMMRVLRGGGIFVASTVNVRAPEFWISSHTPLWFHEMIRGHRAWVTAYSYSSVQELSGKFQRAGFAVDQLRWFPVVGAYLHRFPVVNVLARLYDATLKKLELNGMLGNICLVLRKA